MHSDRTDCQKAHIHKFDEFCKHLWPVWFHIETRILAFHSRWPFKLLTKRAAASKLPLSQTHTYIRN